MNNWCIIIPLVVGIICAILGWLLRNLFSGKEDNTIAELEACRKKRAELEAEIERLQKAQSDMGTTQSDLNKWKNKYAELEGELSDCRSKLAASKLSATATGAAAGIAATAIPFDAAAAKAVYGKSIKQDDLKVVEGIGPKIEQLFFDIGITTWKQLAETPVEKCQEMLNAQGERYKIHRPATWPKQAEMAYQGQWAELAKWQDEMKGGKE